MGRRTTARAFVVALLATGAAAGQRPQLRETWEAMYLGPQKVGYSRIVEDRVDADGSTVVRVDNTSSITMTRFNDTIKMEMRSTTFELPDGRLYAVNATVKQPADDQETIGRLGSDGRFVLTLNTKGKKQEQTVEWSGDVLGPAAIERLVKEKPLAKGEVRTAKTFLPAINQVAAVTVRGLGRQETELLDKKKKELVAVRIEQEFGAGAAKQKLPPTDVWLDEKGEAVKSELPFVGAIKIVSYRTTKAEAMGEAASGPSVDFGFETLVKLSEPIKDARKAKAIEYKLELGDEDAVAAIIDRDYQRVIKREGNAVYVRLLKRTPEPGAKPGAASEEFGKPNGFIQSDDPDIVKIANEVAGPEPDPWKKCQRLEKWVRENMARSDFTVGFSTAADAMKSRRGDCTEHGVLLAALCRAAGVPARVAMGLVYVDSLKAFGFHMWTEVNFGDQWYALDGTLGEGSVGGEHIKVSDSSLKGASAMSTLLPVYNVIGKLKIKVEKVEQ
ncbi:MAG TPA: transglutaminase-like domain-containing protein [Planctomycetia bacterium]|nr:transglutaminase-like domain-containing protein [Planctomycetia bacterium]